MPQDFIKNPYALDVLARVDAINLVPHQQPTPLKNLKKNNTFQYVGVKYPNVGVYHSYAEYIHSLWLESRKAVISFVPHPFLLKVDNSRYVPTYYVLHDDKAEVVQLAKQGVMTWPDPELVRVFFAREQMYFTILNVDEVIAREKEALHWRPIVQTLAAANRYGVDTRADEAELLNHCGALGSCVVGDIINPLRHADNTNHLTALYRLIHRHELEVDLSVLQLDYDTPIQLCI
ncbi:hypothetical protein [uncultured Pseudoteredinibacter sp.]|uniref:hypothetical protein n=1 Tax=uncultured Pseudoteredinibacter sp. TaxID=1641701 RepID=UPI00260768A3|nr:hypothetical protein [uncultured Pseudoteredinibacter sp.]